MNRTISIVTSIKKDIQSMDEGADKQVLLRLAAEAEFMAKELKKLRADIKKNGWTEEYQNGQNQHGIKKSSAGEVYNTLVKNFRETCALALKYIYDAKTAAAKTDELSEFLKQNKKGG